MTDKSEAETAELPALTEAELAAAKRTRPNASPAQPCTDPSYVTYLERQVTALNTMLDGQKAATESARAVILAVGTHNAELTDEVAVLSAENRRLESLRSEALERLLRATREGHDQARELVQLKAQQEVLLRERSQLGEACRQLEEENRGLRRRVSPEGSA